MGVVGQYVLALRPRVVVVENVVGLLGIRFTHHVARLETKLHAAGYEVERLRLNAADFGVAQARRRVFIVAHNLHGRSLRAPTTLAPVSLRDALFGVSGLVDHAPSRFSTNSRHAGIAKHIKQGQRLSNVRHGPRYVRTWDIPEVFGATTAFERLLLEGIATERRRARIRTFGDGDPVSVRRLLQLGGRPVAAVLSKLARQGYLRRHLGGFDFAHTYNGAYHRLCWTGLAPTVDTKFGNPRLFLHPNERRGFTVREAARLQGFPDSFAFSGSSASRFRQIGNAVPPPMASAIAQLVRGLLCS